MSDPAFDGRNAEKGYPVLYQRVLSGTDGWEGAGIFGSSGNVWKTNRKFAMQKLKLFGFGRITSEELFLEEFQHMMKYIR